MAEGRFEFELSGMWEVHLESRLSKGLNIESKDWELFSDGNNPGTFIFIIV